MYSKRTADLNTKMQLKIYIYTLAVYKQGRPRISGAHFLYTANTGLGAYAWKGRLTAGTE